jgi:hypothetical protein
MSPPAIRMRALLAAMSLFTATLALGWAGDDAAAQGEAPRTFSGTTPIVRSAPGAIELAPPVKVYPGETIEIRASGTGNVNQRNYEVRRCKYFGMKCWYEDRSDVNLQPAAKFQIAIVLADSSGRAVEMRNAENGTTAKSFILTGGAPLQLTYDPGPALSKAVVLQVGVTSFDGQDFSRLSCNQRPQFCSSGGLQITVGSKAVEARRDRIDTQLGTTRPGEVNAVRITSRDYLDPLLLSGSENVRAMRGVLVKHIQRWVEAADRNEGTRLVPVIRYALQMSGDQDQTDKLNQALLDTYVLTGAYEAAEDDARTTIASLNERCSEKCEGSEGITDATKLAQAIASLSKALVEKRSRMSTEDIVLSVGTLQRGIAVLEATLAGVPFAANRASIQTLSNLYQDAADRLNLIRTPDEIRHAVVLMERSVCYQKQITDGPDNDEGVFRPEECRTAS